MGLVFSLLRWIQYNVVLSNEIDGKVNVGGMRMCKLANFFSWDDLTVLLTIVSVICVRRIKINEQENTIFVPIKFSSTFTGYTKLDTH